MRVLVVSQSSAERARASSALLARDDVEVLEAHTGGEAHRRVEEGGIDVLVVDGDLDPEGGFSLLYEIRAAGQLRGEPTPPAIVLTTREQDRFLADWAGANARVPKPVDPFRLAALVHELHGQPPAERDVLEAADEVAAAVE